MSMPVIDRALAIRQPFAWAVAAGVKTIENRTIGTPFRGWVAIHASKSNQTLAEFAKKWPSGSPLHEERFDLGALIGVAELVDVIPFSPALEGDPFAQGPLCWQFQNGQLFDEPIPLKGKLNLFKMTAQASALIVEQLARPRRLVIPQSCCDIAKVVAEDFSSRFQIWALSYCQLGDWTNVLRCGIRLTELVPTESTGHRIAGFAHLQLDEFDGAEVAFRKAIEIDSKDAYAWLWLGDVLRRRGNEISADQCTKKAHELGAILGSANEDATDIEG